MNRFASKSAVIGIALILAAISLIVTLVPWWSAEVVPASGQVVTVTFTGMDLSALLVLLQLASALVAVVTAMVQAAARRVSMVMLVLLQVGATAAWFSLRGDIAEVLAIRVMILSANLNTAHSFTQLPVSYIFVLCSVLLALWSLWNIKVVGQWAQRRAKFDRAAPGEMTTTEAHSDIEVWDAISGGSDPTDKMV